MKSSDNGVHGGSALLKSPRGPALEEALFIMVRSYDALGMAQLRDDTKRVMEKNFPRSTYLTRGFNTSQDPWWKIW